MTAPSAVLELGRTFFAGLRPPRRRTHREFAEQELVLADGPRKGTKFQVDFMPFSGLILDEYTRRFYRRFFLTGPAQGAKTLIGFIAPTMFHLFEEEENVILGAPSTVLGLQIYQTRLLPSIRASRYADQLPTSGGGSRGGKSIEIIFRKGQVLRIMGGGGGDQQRSSHPAKIVSMTEVDKMGTAGEASEETNPVNQLETRTDAFSTAATIYGECTMSVEEGRINREVFRRGTGSAPYFPCPHCRKPVALERESFHGWEEAADILEARARANFVCPRCGSAWSEADRMVALRSPILVHKTQEVNEAGQVVGEPPPTDTFGLRWTALASPLRTMADIAAKEYAAAAGNDEDLKGIWQFVWARPYSGEGVDVTKVDAERVLRKIVGHARGVVPPETAALTLGIDVGKYKCWWTLYAWRQGAAGHLVDFGEIEVSGQKKDETNPFLILEALRAFRETRIKPGWGGRRPDLILVDSGYENYDVIYPFVQESGQRPYFAAKGFGSTIKGRAWHEPQNSTTTRQVGNNWRATLQTGGIVLIEIHSDYWKGHVHDGYAAAVGAPGSITVCNGQPTEKPLRDLANQITAERRRVERPEGKEAVVVWVVESRRNHYLDTSVLCRVAADQMGIKIIEQKKPIADRPQVERRPPGGHQGIRVSY